MLGGKQMWLQRAKTGCWSKRVDSKRRAGKIANLLPEP